MMQKRALVIVCLVLLLIVFVIAQKAKAKSTGKKDDPSKTNMVLWKKYKHELIHAISRHWCKTQKQTYPCAEMDKTVFQIVDEPADALWHKSRYYLNEGVCKFVPAWQSSFEPRIAGYDGEYPKVYGDFLKAVPKAFVNESAQAFVKFALFKGESFKFKNVTKSYSWLELRTTLDAFVETMKNSTLKADEYGWKFSISRDTKTENHSNKWGLKLPFTIQKSFVRKVDAEKKQKPLTDALFNENEVSSGNVESAATEEADKDQIEDLSASEWWFFRRRRRSSPPPKPVKPLIIKTKTFKISFMAKGIKAIHVKPDAWFDRKFVTTVSTRMKKWFGKNGQMSLLPRTIYVAYQPRVEIIVSESQLGGVKEDLNQKGVLEWLIGGVKFKGYNTKPMSDSSIDDDEPDLVNIEEVKEEKDAKEVIVPVSAKKKEELRRKLLQPNKPASEEGEDNIEDLSAAEWWFFRRRRRRSPPPKPKTPAPRKERNFKLTFSSRSKTPQILGVVSDILPM